LLLNFQSKTIEFASIPSIPSIPALINIDEKRGDGMRFAEFRPKSYEIIVTAPQTVITPETYHSISDAEELLHIPVEAPEVTAKRRKMYLLAWMAAKELEQKPPTTEEWEVCSRAFDLLKQIASKDYQLSKLKNKEKIPEPFVHIER
jgi:hypothetical protein